MALRTFLNYCAAPWHPDTKALLAKVEGRWVEPQNDQITDHDKP